MRSPAILHFFTSPIHWAHRAVIFATARLSCIEEVLDNGLPSVVMGDMNFSCNVDNEGYKQCYNVLSRYNVFHCDEFIDGGTGNCVTYYNHSLHHSSFLDHCVRDQHYQKGYPVC